MIWTSALTMKQLQHNLEDQWGKASSNIHIQRADLSLVSYLLCLCVHMCPSLIGQQNPLSELYGEES
jgi:hypothetical protein